MNKHEKINYVEFPAKSIEAAKVFETKNDKISKIQLIFDSKAFT